ncbi:MAG: hypothetical protein IT261_04800 [Saprospiraceae bacterium]|nr:hypothetical protein [Saprospiraceae bacterium]
MMKNTFLAALLILALGQICHFGLPWWALVFISGLAGWFTKSAWQAFFGGFLGGAILWWLAAFLQDNANDSALSERVGQLFQGASSTQLLLLTGIMGGLVAALGALTGKLAKDLLVKPSRRHYLQERRRR